MDLPAVNQQADFSQPLKAQFLCNQQLTETAKKVVVASKGAILGMHNLVNFDSDRGMLTLSDPFKSFLSLFVEAGVLSAKVFEACSLDELNAILQLSQGEGGFMRPKGAERWDLTDNETLVQRADVISDLQAKMGFSDPQALLEKISVDHCIVFGARVSRMIARLKATADYLKKNVRVTGNITLSGSNRLLISDEITDLYKQIEGLGEERKAFWTKAFASPENRTEAKAFTCLWECIVPKDLQERLQSHLSTIESTRAGSSHEGAKGTRVTTAVAAEDWIKEHLVQDRPQSVFAVVEQPYVRVPMQFQAKAYSTGTSSVEELLEKINNIRFHFVTVPPPAFPGALVFIDEVARNIFVLTRTITWLESL